MLPPPSESTLPQRQHCWAPCKLVEVLHPPSNPSGQFQVHKAYVTAPILLRVPDEGTLGAEKHLEAHLDKLLEGGGVKVTPLVGFRLLSHPLFHLGV
jgi:hypothetical protein